MRRSAVNLVFVLSALAASLVGVAFVTIAPAAAAGTVNLTVRDFEFAPASLTITAGTMLRVTNTGASPHTWSSDAGAAQSWDSGSIAPGGSFSVTFDQAGTFGYHCNIHAFMTGSITVTAAVATTTAPPVTTVPSPTITQVPVASTLPGTVPGPATTAVAPTDLPRTGVSSSTALGVLAAVLTVAGATLLFVASGVQRRRRAGR